jgi:hypothetical protein
MIEWCISADELDWVPYFFSGGDPLKVYHEQLAGFSENAVRRRCITMI